MKNNIIVKDYQSILNIHDTQIAIKIVKDTFEDKLAEALELTRVTAPLFVAYIISQEYIYVKTYGKNSRVRARVSGKQQHSILSAWI